jgi:alkylation response protein AidB-like acyl-CoA dehydrogenase
VTVLESTFEEFAAAIRGFVQEHVLGREQALDVRGELPLACYEAFVAADLANWWLPRRLGGRGIRLEQSVDVVAELAYGDAGLAFAFFLPILGTTAIDLFGSDEQRQRYLAELSRSGAFCATMASEAVAGSELIRMTTEATPGDGGYRVTGEKFFSTNAELADFFVVYARLEGTTPAFGAFVVPRDAEGIQIVKRWPTIGVRAAGTYELSLDGCPAAQPLTGNGLRILEVALNASRTLMAASAVGVGRRIRDTCLAYAATKEIKGTSLLENPVFIAKLGQMEADLQAMLSVCRTAAREFDEIIATQAAADRFMHVGTLRSVIVAKMLCGQLGWKIASMGSEMLGGLGYTDESLMGKLVRDMRYVSIVEAGDDVLRELMFSRHVLPAFLSSRG